MTTFGSGKTLSIALSISDLNEVIALLERHNYSKASYNKLGQRLNLSHNTLEEIKKDHKEVHSCFTECLASWLRKADNVQDPTIDILIAALRGIGENAVADGIDEEMQRTDRPLATSPTLCTSEREGHPVQPVASLNPGVDDLELKIDQCPELQEIANNLQGKYDFLVIAVQKSLEDHQIDVKNAKMLIKRSLIKKSRVVSELKPCIDILEKIYDFESFFEFLSKYDFIGYLNYKLLKKLAELVKDDEEINELFLEYEKEYAKLLSSASFHDFIPLFERKSNLSPTAPLGLPYISFRLEKPWLFTVVYTWVSTFGKFSWSYYALLKQLRKNCVIITYAILPCVLDEVMRDLKDPVILKKLEDEGVIVIELPQEEEGKKEASEEGGQEDLKMLLKQYEKEIQEAKRELIRRDEEIRLKDKEIFRLQNKLKDKEDHEVNEFKGVDEFDKNREMNREAYAAYPLVMSKGGASRGLQDAEATCSYTLKDYEEMRQNEELNRLDDDEEEVRVKKDVNTTFRRVHAENRNCFKKEMDFQNINDEIIPNRKYSHTTEVTHYPVSKTLFATAAGDSHLPVSDLVEQVHSLEIAVREQMELTNMRAMHYMEEKHQLKESISHHNNEVVKLQQMVMNRFDVIEQELRLNREQVVAEIRDELHDYKIKMREMKVDIEEKLKLHSIEQRMKNEFLAETCEVLKSAISKVNIPGLEPKEEITCSPCETDENPHDQISSECAKSDCNHGIELVPNTSIKHDI